MMTRAEIARVFSGAAFPAAKANVFIKRWQKEFPELWSDEQLARNVPLRIEFEQVYVFGTVAEAISWPEDLVAIPEEVAISADGEASSASIRWIPTTQ